MTEFVPEAVQIITGGLMVFVLLAIITAIGEFLKDFMGLL